MLGLVPTLVVTTTAVITHRPVAALLAGVLVGIVILAPTNIIGSLAEITPQVMQDETIGWVVMVCGSMGSLIYLLIQTVVPLHLRAAWQKERSRVINPCWSLGFSV